MLLSCDIPFWHTLLQIKEILGNKNCRYNYLNMVNIAEGLFSNSILQFNIQFAALTLNYSGDKEKVTLKQHSRACPRIRNITPFTQRYVKAPILHISNSPKRIFIFYIFCISFNFPSICSCVSKFYTKWKNFGGLGQLGSTLALK